MVYIYVILKGQESAKVTGSYMNKADYAGRQMSVPRYKQHKKGKNGWLASRYLHLLEPSIASLRSKLLRSKQLEGVPVRPGLDCLLRGSIRVLRLVRLLEVDFRLHQYRHSLRRDFRSVMK